MTLASAAAARNSHPPPSPLWLSTPSCAACAAAWKLVQENKLSLMTDTDDNRLGRELDWGIEQGGKAKSEATLSQCLAEAKAATSKEHIDDAIVKLKNLGLGDDAAKALTADTFIKELDGLDPITKAFKILEKAPDLKANLKANQGLAAKVSDILKELKVEDDPPNVKEDVEGDEDGVVEDDSPKTGPNNDPDKVDDPNNEVDTPKVEETDTTRDAEEKAEAKRQKEVIDDVAVNPGVNADANKETSVDVENISIDDAIGELKKIDGLSEAANALKDKSFLESLKKISSAQQKTYIMGKLFELDPKKLQENADKISDILEKLKEEEEENDFT